MAGALRVIGANTATFALRLDDGPADVTLLHAAEGGVLTGTVVRELGGPAFHSKKSIGERAVEELVVEVGLSMSQVLFDWMADTWNGAAEKRSGAILACDPYLSVTNERAFAGALITSIAVPALDAGSKDVGNVTIRFATESATLRIPPSTPKLLLGPAWKQTLTFWRAANFRLLIDGLDCSKVSRIDPFTVRRAVTASPPEPDAPVTLEPGKVDFPDLRITLPEVSAQSWLQWYDDFLIGGHDTDDLELQAAQGIREARVKAQEASSCRH